MNGDLHVHTRTSDGSLTPSEIIELAGRCNIGYLSFTNHDAFTPLDEGALNLANSFGITLIEGIEISSLDPKRNRRVHILCYMPRKCETIKALCDITVSNRDKAGREMAKKVASLYPIDIETIYDVASESTCIYKQHITAALLKAGYTTEIFGSLYRELFDFSRGSCIISCKAPSIYDVLEAVKQSGGVCVMAHPFTYDSIDLLNELLAENVLDGIEVWSSKSTDEQEKYLLSLARDNNLVATGGSDFHGAYGSRVSPVGIKPMPKAEIDKLLMLADR